MFDPITATLGAAAIGGGLGLVGSGMQAGAARDAARSQERSAQDAIDYQREIDARNLGLSQNYLNIGDDAMKTLGQRIYGGAYDMPAYSYEGFGYSPEDVYRDVTSPIVAQIDPGFNFRLQQGQRALEQGAAAKGKFFSGDTGKALLSFGQELASDEYSNAYDRALRERANRLGAYATTSGQSLAQEGARMNAYQTNRARLGDQYGRLRDLVGIGQNALGMVTGQGQQSAQNIGGYLTGAGQAQAAGQLGQAQAWAGGLGNLGNQLIGGMGSYLNYQMLQNALRPQPAIA